MRGAGSIKHFLFTWLDKSTNLFRFKFTLPVASAQINNISSDPQSNPNNIIKLDSGATQYYLKVEHAPLLQNINIPEKNHNINLTNNETI